MANVPLLHLFDDMVRKSEVLSSGIEKEFIAFATYQENCRQQWCLDQDEIAKLRKENAKLKADTEALNAKLTHARNEQLSERNKRQKAENAQQHLESQVALIKELLNDEDARNRLKEKEVKLLTQISHCQQVIVNSPVKRAHEPDVSQLSASFSDDDYTEDDLTNTVNKFGEVEEHTPPKRLRKSYSTVEAKIPGSEVNGSPVLNLSKATSAVYLKPLENQAELPPSGSKPQHQQVARLSQRTNTDQRTPNTRSASPIWSNSQSNGKKPKSHDFVSKTVLKPESCKACGKLIRFAKLALKCRDCRVICTPNSTKKPVEENIEFYAPTVSPRIPALVLRCVEEIERRGLNQLGLYRVPGSEARVRELMAEFLKGKGSPDLTKETDENVICGTLKSFLKQLSEPILTYALHKRFLEAVEKPDEDDALLFQAVSELPAANRDTLAYLMVHLQKIAQSRECKMPVTNIAKVFAPTLVGYSCPHPEPVQMLTEAKIQPKIVEKLLEMPVDYWKQFLSVNEENIRSPPFNPNTHNADGTPKTPQGLTAPGASMLGPARSGDTPGGKSVKKKGSLLGRTPLTPRFGSKSKRPNKRPHHFFDSPMLK
ncbi:rac GTPase-activating protein 1-like isoform X2 [Xenia sp. Carnegie-2017]|uniref:rac GTPase-activating protein 1-like isoform X2 n=1 Tax=Xenia sp. Carnegie-2017 TaxID=2897299 RepID=UPI001F04CDDB|nr:rac GTPase-activating protein 1-like isoform X2 [Xenia sp. Carnegie-2017]